MSKKINDKRNIPYTHMFHPHDNPNSCADVLNIFNETNLNRIRGLSYKYVLFYIADKEIYRKICTLYAEQTKTCLFILLYLAIKNNI